MARPTNWPTTTTQLANRAMSLIGERPVFVDIDTDSGENADLVRQALYETIREAQTSFLWPELHTVTVITTPDATLTDASAYPYSYRFALPDDYVRAINLNTYDYQIIGNFIYTNTPENLTFHYGRYEEDLELWSGPLYRLIKYRLSLEICLQISQAPQVYERILSEFKQFVEPEAFRIQSYAIEHPNERLRGQGQYARTRNGRY